MEKEHEERFWKHIDIVLFSLLIIIYLFSFTDYLVTTTLNNTRLIIVLAIWIQGNRFFN